MVADLKALIGALTAVNGGAPRGDPGQHRAGVQPVGMAQTVNGDFLFGSPKRRAASSA